MDLAKCQTRIQARQKEIGLILRENRLAHGQTMETCARLLGILPQSYASIENGETAISILVLEFLMDALEIPRDEIWPPKGMTGWVRRVELPLVPGETLQITVDVSERL